MKTINDFVLEKLKLNNQSQLNNDKFISFNDIIKYVHKEWECEIPQKRIDYILHDILMYTKFNKNKIRFEKCNIDDYDGNIKSNLKNIIQRIKGDDLDAIKGYYSGVMYDIYTLYSNEIYNFKIYYSKTFLKEQLIANQNQFDHMLLIYDTYLKTVEIYKIIENEKD